MVNQLQHVTEKIKDRVQSKPAFGHKVKLVLENVGVVYMDGTSGQNTVSNDDLDADLILETSYAVMQEIDKGTLDAFSAYMQGRLTIQGDQSIAVAFGALIES